MARLGSVALIVLALSAAAWSKPPSAGPAEGDRSRRIYILPQSSDFQQFVPVGPTVRARVAPNAHFGLGIFGLIPEKTHLQPVTVREVGTSKQRRAAVGFSLRF